VDVAVACRVLGVSRSGYYDWLGRPPSLRDQENDLLVKQIERIHLESRGTYGWPRVTAELALGLGMAVNHKRVARLMRQAGLQGVYRRRQRRGPVAEATAQDLVRRQFTVEGPDRLWLTDITEHPTSEGKVYCAAVMDAYSRRIIGWSIAHHIRTELVLDALGMAILRRQPPKDQTILHSDHGTQGEFNWSSQHLDLEVLEWDDGRVGQWRRRGGRGCGRRGGRRWRCGSSGSGFGRRSLEG
jgi:putative transposase